MTASCTSSQSDMAILLHWFLWLYYLGPSVAYDTWVLSSGGGDCGGRRQRRG